MRERCQVEGCDNVRYRSVVCRQHWAKVPFELRVRRMIAAHDAVDRAVRATDWRVLKAAQE